MPDLPILELGVQRGGSLRVWADHFPASLIHGIDCDPAAMIHDHSRIVTHLANTRDAERLSAIGAAHGPFQLVIDDASHKPFHVMAAYAVLCNFVAKGGMYIIEDIQNEEFLRIFNLWPNAECFDRRDIKGRSDDILVVIRL